jgi:hypothetical protein
MENCSILNEARKEGDANLAQNLASSMIEHAQTAHPDGEAVKQLQRYILDYLKKHGKTSDTIWRSLAEAMDLREEDVLTAPIETATGFLLDWWLLFWDVTRSKSVPQMKAYLSDMKQATSPFSDPAATVTAEQAPPSQKRPSETSSSQDRSPQVSHKKTKPECQMEAILEVQKAHVAAAQAITMKQQEILNATLAHSRQASFSQALPGPMSAASPAGNASMNSMLTPDFDSLNLEERKIWLQQLQQQNAAVAMYAMSSGRLPLYNAPPANNYYSAAAAMSGGPPTHSATSLLTRTAPPSYQWLMPPPSQPYTAAGPLFGPASGSLPLMSASVAAPMMAASQATPPLFYNPTHRYQNLQHQTVPTTPQYIKPAPVPPSSSSQESSAMLGSQAALAQQQTATCSSISTTNTSQSTSSSSLLMDPATLLAKTHHPFGTMDPPEPTTAEVMPPPSSASPTKYANLMNESLMNESLFLDLDDIFFNSSP